MVTPDRSPSEAEWELLEALWSHERATAREIGESLADTRGWAYSTVKTMLDRMVDKGLVATRRVGNVYEYRAAVERSEAARSAWKTFVDRAFGGAALPALHFAATDTRLTAKQRAKLLRLIGGEEQ